MSTSFMKWLRAQASRFYRVGDLADDVARDRGTRYFMSPERLRSRMLEMNACSLAMLAFEQAVREWKGSGVQS
jgi:hypothetical protein